MGYPSVGSWVAYGLGTENQSLPGFVVVYDYRGGPFSGPTNWSSGFLPATYQGTVFRSSGDPVLDLNPPPEHVSPEQQRARLDHLAWLNEEHARRHPGSSELAARIASYELAFRMQACAPDVVDISKETEKTKRLYGMDHPTTEPFGKQWPVGPAAGGARGALRPALQRRLAAAEHRHLGRPQQPGRKPHPARRRS